MTILLTLSISQFDHCGWIFVLIRSIHGIWIGRSGKKFFHQKKLFPLINQWHHRILQMRIYLLTDFITSFSFIFYLFFTLQLLPNSYDWPNLITLSWKKTISSIEDRRVKPQIFSWEALQTVIKLGPVAIPLVLVVMVLFHPYSFVSQHRQVYR